MTTSDVTIYLSCRGLKGHCEWALNWTLDLIFGKDLVHSQTFRASTMSMKEEAMEKQAVVASPDHSHREGK